MQGKEKQKEKQRGRGKERERKKRKRRKRNLPSIEFIPMQFVIKLVLPKLEVSLNFQRKLNFLVTSAIFRTNNNNNKNKKRCGLSLCKAELKINVILPMF